MLGPSSAVTLTFHLVQQIGQVKLSESRRAVHFGLLKDFLQLTLALPVRRNGSPVSLNFTSVLTHGRAVQKTGTLWENIAV